MPDVIRIFEKEAQGGSMFETLVNRMQDGSRRSDDMRDTFLEIAGQIKDELTYEFSEANPAGWGDLSDKYKQWKTRHGYPVTIGIMTGALKESLTDSAVIDAQPKRLTYTYNESTRNAKGQSVGEYAKFFNAEREIMPHIKDRINEITKDAVAEAVNQGFQGKL